MGYLLKFQNDELLDENEKDAFFAKIASALDDKVLLVAKGHNIVVKGGPAAAQEIARQLTDHDIYTQVITDEDEDFLAISLPSEQPLLE